MSIQQWQRTLGFMTFFLVLAWSVLGLTPDSVLATNEIIDYFPPPTPHEIAVILHHVSLPNPTMLSLTRSDESVFQINPAP